MKNPHAIVVFGQRYDGSNEVTITPKIATESEVGCVKPVAKTSSMNTAVGIDSNGRLYTTGTLIDAVITAYSDNAASSNAVYQYGIGLTSQMQTLVSDTKKEIEDDQEQQHTEIEKEIQAVNESIDDLKTSGASQLDAIGKRIDQTNTSVSANATEISKVKDEQTAMNTAISKNSDNIQFNTQDISNLKPRVTQVETDLTEVKSRNIGYFFDTETDLLDWVKIQSNQDKLGVGVCLYVKGNPQLFYTWNGTDAIKTEILASIAGGYMQAQNPTGSGYMRMNNNQVGSSAASFGQDNMSAGVYSFTAGHGVKVNGETAAAFGAYNATPKSDEIFSIGAGADDDNRKTVHYISDTGDSHQLRDVTAFDKDLGASNSPDESKQRVSYKISKIPDDVVINVDYQFLIDTVTLSDSAKYVFTYSSGHWNSDCYDFSYIAQQQTYYRDIGTVGITFEYASKAEGSPVFDFTEGDTIEVYAPLQKTISLRALYNTVNGLGLYIDADGDVCQED